MRYRPLAHHNMAISAVSLALSDEGGPRTATEWMALIYAALEAGINSFDVQGRHPAIGDALGRALQAVERRLVTVSWRLGPRTIPEQYADRAFTPPLIQAAIQSALARTGLDCIDILLLDDPGDADLPPQTLTLLKDLRARNTIRHIGIAGEGPAIDAYISTGAFGVLGLPYNMASGWRERLRIRAALDREMAVFGYNSIPADLRQAAAPPEARRGLWGRKRPPASPPAGPYEFLFHTPHWTAAEICLAFCLTEPGLATVQIAPRTIEELQGLAAAADRDLPSGLAAQIEMARIGLGAGDDSQRRA